MRRSLWSPLAAIGNKPEHRDYRDRPHFGVDIDRSVRIEAFVTVDAGTMRPTRIGPRTWLMKRVHVAHDCDIGRNCELSPGVTMGGWCEIGDDVRIGLGAVLRPRVKVGAGARIGAGAVVVKDVPAGETWVGNPARPIDREKEYERFPVAPAEDTDEELWNAWWLASRA